MGRINIQNLSHAQKLGCGIYESIVITRHGCWASYDFDSSQDKEITYEIHVHTDMPWTGFNFREFKEEVINGLKSEIIPQLKRAGIMYP